MRLFREILENKYFFLCPVQILQMEITYFIVTKSQIQVSGKYFRMVSVSGSSRGGSLRGGSSRGGFLSFALCLGFLGTAILLYMARGAMKLQWRRWTKYWVQWGTVGHSVQGKHSLVFSFVLTVTCYCNNSGHDTWNHSFWWRLGNIFVKSGNSEILEKTS